jgi:hypothetical protein
MPQSEVGGADWVPGAQEGRATVRDPGAEKYAFRALGRDREQQCRNHS